MLNAKEQFQAAMKAVSKYKDDNAKAEDKKFREAVKKVSARIVLISKGGDCRCILSEASEQYSSFAVDVDYDIRHRVAEWFRDEGNAFQIDSCDGVEYEINW